MASLRFDQHSKRRLYSRFMTNNAEWIERSVWLPRFAARYDPVTINQDVGMSEL